MYKPLNLNAKAGQRQNRAPEFPKAVKSLFYSYTQTSTAESKSSPHLRPTCHAKIFNVEKNLLEADLTGWQHIRRGKAAYPRIKACSVHGGGGPFPHRKHGMAPRGEGCTGGAPHVLQSHGKARSKASSWG